MSSGNCSVTIPVPPPPAIEFRSNSKECRYSQIAYSKSPVHFECDWASQVPEVQRASALAHVCMKTKPKFCRIKQNIKAVIQSGPTCGLTALKMLLGAHADDQPSTDDILVLAKRKKYTNHGEMFCAKHLKELTESVFDLVGHSVRIDIFSGKLNCDHIKTELSNGACILVAYDSDFNHAPCLKNGHKAHWALIVGCLIDDHDKFHVFSRHGKTKNLALWSLAALSDSNSNLNEYTAPHRYDDYSFQMPVDGIAGENGLKNQCIIINGIQNVDDFIIK